MEKLTARLETIVPLLFSISMFSPGLLHAQDTSIAGLWVNSSAMPDHPSWRMADQLWEGGPRVAYDNLSSLLSDPTNDERPLSELMDETREMVARYLRDLRIEPAEPASSVAPSGDPYDDPRVQCEPIPFFLVLQGGPHPFSIEFQGNDVVIHHELQNTLRRIPLDQDRAVQSPGVEGKATARIENGVLVVETTGFDPVALPPFGVVTTDAAHLVERYIPDPGDPDRLEYEVELHDPGTFRRPLVALSPRVRIDGEIQIEEPCEVMYEESRQ